MTFTPKTWTNAPSEVSPISAEALVDLETRLSAYTDTGDATQAAYTDAGDAAQQAYTDAAIINDVTDASGHGTTDFAVMKEAPLNVQYAEYGAKCDGSTHDDAAMALALAALPSRGGEILIPGPMVLSAQLDLDGKTGLTLIGLGGITAGAQPASSINFVQAGSTTALSVRDTYGMTFRDLGILSTNASFTGGLIDASWTGTGGDGGYLSMENAFVFANPNCARLLDLHQTQECCFSNVNFYGAQYAVRGLTGSSNDFSTAQTFLACAFRGSVLSPIQSAGQGWAFINPTVEPLSGGGAGFLNQGVGKLGGFSIVGGWFGDTVTGTWIYLPIAGGNGISIHGTYFGGSLTAINFAANVSAVDISGNKFDQCGFGVAVQASVACTDFIVAANDFSTCTTAGISKGSGATFTRALLMDNKAGTGDMYGVTVH